VLDPFAGCGSILIACQNQPARPSNRTRSALCRRCYLALASFLRQQATLAATGQSFEEVTRVRHAAQREADPSPE
jgi:hypothetical protein